MPPKANNKYDFDLKLLGGDEEFKSYLHKSFTLFEDISSGMTNPQKDALLFKIQGNIQEKYKSKDAEIGHIYKSWWENDRSFGYLNNNPYDVELRDRGSKYNYEWLLNKSDSEITDLLSQNPALKKAYSITTQEDEYTKLMRQRHAAASVKEGFVHNVDTREHQVSRENRWLMMAGKDVGVKAGVNYVLGATDSYENIVDELRNNGLLPESLESNLQRISKASAKKANKSNDELSKAISSLRYIDNPDELKVYYQLIEQEEK